MLQVLEGKVADDLGGVLAELVHFKQPGWTLIPGSRTKDGGR